MTQISALSIEFTGIKKSFLNLKSFMIQNTLFSGLTTLLSKMNKTELQEYTDKYIFKQGPRKCALHSSEPLFTLRGSVLWNLLKAVARRHQSRSSMSTCPTTTLITRTHDSAKGQTPPGQRQSQGLQTETAPRRQTALLQNYSSLISFCPSALTTGAARTSSAFPMSSSPLFFQKAFGKTMHCACERRGTATDDHRSLSCSACNLMSKLY